MGGRGGTPPHSKYKTMKVKISILFILSIGCVKKNNISEPLPTKNNKHDTQSPFYNPYASIQQPSQLKVATISIDTLTIKSKVVSSTLDEIQKEYLRLQNELRKKYEEFQKKLKEYEQSYSTLSRAEAILKESELKAEQEKLQKLDQEYSDYFLKLQQKKQEATYSIIKKGIDSLVKKYGFTLILTSGTGTNVLYAHDSLDYTNEIIQIIDNIASSPSKKAK